MKHIFIRRRLITLTMLLFLAVFLPVGQATAQTMQEPAPEGSVPVDPKDPWENWNRKVYTFNETIDRWFLKPPGIVSKGHHVQLLTFTQDTLTCRVILLGGKLFDEVVIVPHQQRLGSADK